MGAALRAASTKGGGRLRRPPPFVDSSGGGISALRLVRSARPCAMPAKSVFVLKTKVSCPAAASGVFFGPGGSAALVQVPPAVFSGPKIGQGRKLVKKIKRIESSQNGLVYGGKS